MLHPMYQLKAKALREERRQEQKGVYEQPVKRERERERGEVSGENKENSAGRTLS